MRKILDTKNDRDQFLNIPPLIKILENQNHSSAKVSISLSNIPKEETYKSSNNSLELLTLLQLDNSPANKRYIFPRIRIYRSDTKRKVKIDILAGILLYRQGDKIVGSQPDTRISFQYLFKEHNNKT